MQAEGSFVTVTMNEIAVLRHISLITLLITTLITPYNTELSGSTPNLKDIFIGRCWDFQYKKFASSRPLALHLWKNCTNIWSIFHKCFAFKDPCKLTFSDYEPYFAAFGESKVINKVRNKQLLFLTCFNLYNSLLFLFCSCCHLPFSINDLLKRRQALFSIFTNIDSTKAQRKLLGQKENSTNSNLHFQFFMQFFRIYTPIFT